MKLILLNCTLILQTWAQWDLGIPKALTALGPSECLTVGVSLQYQNLCLQSQVINLSPTTTLPHRLSVLSGTRACDLEGQVFPASLCISACTSQSNPPQQMAHGIRALLQGCYNPVCALLTAGSLTFTARTGGRSISKVS